MDTYCQPLPFYTVYNPPNAFNHPDRLYYVKVKNTLAAGAVGLLAVNRLRLLSLFEGLVV